jgi:hypothetical protein
LAGTTGLEPAASAETVSGLQVLSTTWKSTDGTASPSKYVIDNAILYRDGIAEGARLLKILGNNSLIMTLLDSSEHKNGVGYAITCAALL